MGRAAADRPGCSRRTTRCTRSGSGSGSQIRAMLTVCNNSLTGLADLFTNIVNADKLEPKNKQILQALQFCEVRLAQEERKRMEGY